MNTCPVPDSRELAIYCPEGEMHGYELMLMPNLKYWSKQERRADDEVIPALADMSDALQQLLIYSIENWPKVINSDLLRKERVRRIALASLAISLLLRNQWGSEVVVGDGIGAGEAETMLDMYSELEDTAWPLEFRVHITPIQENAPTPAISWHRTKNLFIRQVRPSEPTDYLRSFVVEHNISADFTQLETIYPFLPSRV